MFTFLRSGGTIDRIILKPLDPDDRKVLATFDIRKADCFLQSDKQRLLSIVESSYFSSGAFNAACRKILVTKLRLDEAPSSLQAPSLAREVLECLQATEDEDGSCLGELWADARQGVRSPT